MHAFVEGRLITNPAAWPAVAPRWISRWPTRNIGKPWRLRPISACAKSAPPPKGELTNSPAMFRVP